MRIGLIAPPWIQVPPPAYGGTELVVDLLARGLADAGHDVLLAASADSTCPVPLVPGLDPAHPADLDTTKVELAHVIHAYEAMAEVDVIHDHTLAGPLYRYRPGPAPVVATNHGPFTAPYSTIYRAMGRGACIVAISHHQASTADDIRVDRVIHHGIYMDTVPVGAGDGGYVCFLGRMTPDKGIAEAIAIARTAGIPLKIAAKMREPAEVQYFDSTIRPALGPDVEFLGEISPEEKYALLGSAAALLNPIQWNEPFGLNMIEALGCGTPVVGTPRGAAPEIVVHGLTGFLSADMQQLPGFLQRAGGLDRAQCRAHAERHFSSRRMVQDHILLYEQLLQGGLCYSAAGAAGPGKLPGTG
ncbi:glycosyltransferase family 4 protein [Arthrobacter sp. I2-34]|uniref:Glycosyltransferase family 4 protein n=1 Tax=Arthrobacter hankyongi TaxID=2904801 RepID=A0ABS9LE97_9MICC|nr:glycosyltransferase family 4 protein [Arthrobacter hankyongi]MCG2624843.1 glycosyltransferase family 4 protein [Arthrobacter hankyongi]